MGIKDAQEKLQKEAAESKSSLVQVLAGHLCEVMDETLASFVVKVGYSADEMGKYVLAKAKEALNGQNGALEDAVVYRFASEYYQSSREEIDKVLGLRRIAADAPKADDPVAPPKPPKPKQKDEQISLFDFLGG